MADIISPERRSQNMAVLNLEFDKLQENLIGHQRERKYRLLNGICYFLIFTMDYLGYHI